MRPLQRLVDSAAFNSVIIGVILANAVVLGLQTYPGIVDSIHVGGQPPAPVAERIQILRAALDELEQELATEQPQQRTPT